MTYDRLNDPGEHFPYKHEVASALVADNPAMGPDGPDDDRARAEDFLSPDIVDRTAAYIAAQADYLRDPGDATSEMQAQAAAELVAARQAHRANRPATPVVIGIRSRRAGE
jgi:hypothetical protein